MPRLLFRGTEPRYPAGLAVKTIRTIRINSCPCRDLNPGPRFTQPTHYTYRLRYTNFYEKESIHFTCLSQTISLASYINIYLHFCTNLTPTPVKYFVRFKFLVLQTEIWCPRQFVSSTYPSNSATTQRNINCASSVALLEGRRHTLCYKHIL
jgi:hypothetical protein